jgi:hypothetical protein
MKVDLPISKSQLQILLEAKAGYELAQDKFNGLLTMAVVGEYENAKVTGINSDTCTISLEIPDQEKTDIAPAE